MKIIAILILAAASVSAQTVTVQSARSVVIDGAPSGNLVDVVANHPVLAPQIQRAAEAWQRDLAQKHSAMLAEVERAHLDEIEELKRTHAGAIAALIAKASTDGARAAAEVQRVAGNAENQASEARKEVAFLKEKLASVLNAVRLGNREVLDVEIAAARKTRAQARRDLLDQQIRELQTQKAQAE